LDATSADFPGFGALRHIVAPLFCRCTPCLVGVRLTLANNC
jgi:hypothetical protein